jgi:predicted XRE-type DNA-binding protein
VTQREAERQLGVTQPHLAEVLNGKLSKFSLDALMALAQRGGIKVASAIENA